MTDLTLMGGSPFDTIRRVDDRGEYWSARDLQPAMGYPTWQHFRAVIDRAMAAAENTGADVSVNFTVIREVSGARGPAREDFRLTRYGAYLAAMNGDPRKEEVAKGQTYFAVKTREAETRTTVRELSRRELADYWARAEAELEVEKAKVAELAPAAQSWQQLAEAAGDYSLREAAQILDRDPSIRTGQNRLSKHLKCIGWVDVTGQPYQRQVDAGRLVVRSRTFKDPVTGDDRIATQLRVTAKGLGELHREMGGSGPLLLEVAS